MKACNGLCKCLAVGVIAFGVNAYGQEFSWVPVDSDVAFSTAGADAVGEPTEMIVTATSAPIIVEWEMRLNGWRLASGSPTLGAAQAGVDATGFLGANASPANPGVDLTVLNGTPWQTNLGGNGLNDGAFIGTDTCHTFTPPATFTDTGEFCGSIPATIGWATCAVACNANPRFVFSVNLAVGSVATSTPNIVWGGVTNAGVCTVDVVDAQCTADGMAGTQPAPCCTGAGTGNCPGSYYLGTLVLDVPGGAGGSYTWGFDPSLSTSFMNDCSGSALQGVAKTPGTLTLETGACCDIVGPGTTSCTDNVLAEDCAFPDDSLPGDETNLFWNAGLSCADVAAAGGCPSCTQDSDCNDLNACTDDDCIEATAVCTHTDNFDPSTECCVIASGFKEDIDDGDACTEDSCDAAGNAVHDPTNPTTSPVSCDDGITRTCPDVCDDVNSQADGGCVGPDISTFPCTSDADCCIGFCDVTGFCELIEAPSLCIDFSQDNEKDPNCYDDGDIFTATVSVGGSSQTITGGQFLMNYDPTCVEVLDVHTCAGSVFTNVIADSVDSAAGTIFFTVTVDPTTGVGTNEDADVVCIDLKKLDTCGQCDICFDSVNPYNTRLVNADGNEITELDPACGACSKLIELAGDITLNVPEGDDVNSECDLPTAIVTWNAPNASDSCDGALAVTCASQHDGGVPIGHLLWLGGEFPQGTSFFMCETGNSCGNTDKKVWTVKVSDQQSLDIYVQLQPTVDPGMFSRCVCFELFDDCVSGPTEYCDVLWFGGPFNFDGKTRTKVKVDKGQYHCITARDPHHSLRSTADILCVDGQYQAEFRGDPLLGGNWLIAGNLDFCKAGGGGSPDTIDILDFGMFMNEIASGASYPNGSTDCNTPCPHADINGDGDVDNMDYAFILDNYLKASKDSCCPDSDFIAPPVESITVKELRALGLGELAVGDLNRDGVLDANDMAEYMSGAEPVAIERVRKGSKVDGFRGR